MNNKILITGSNGLLGQKLTDLLIKEKEYEFLATGVGENRHPNQTINYQVLDITNKKEVENSILNYKPDFLINTAAMTNVDACEGKKEECDQLNVEAVKYLTDACNLINCKLIHISTDFIFDGTAGPYKETDKPNPLSYYGWSKLKGEEYVIKESKNWAILRTVLVYGLVHDMSRSNIVLWAKNALANKQKISVVDDQFRTPTLAEDLAMGCFLAVKNNANGIYNISGKDFMSVYDLVERVAKYFNLSMENVSRTDSKNLIQAAVRPPVTGFDFSKSVKELGYKPHSVEEGIAILETQIRQ